MVLEHFALAERRITVLITCVKMSNFHLVTVAFVEFLVT